MKKQVAALIGTLCLAAIAAARTRAVVSPTPIPTFSREIARIFQQNCEGCHRPGAMAPFSLRDYRDAYPQALAIKVVTSARTMPPWKPADDCGEFVGARRLSDGDIATIRRWVEAGAPEGNRSDLPVPLDWSSDWPLGPPDMILEPSAPFSPPSTADTFRCFVLPADFAQDRYVSVIDFLPGAREFVHHVSADIDTSGKADFFDAADPASGFDLFAGGLELTTSPLGVWVPNAAPSTLPPGVALRIPAGGQIVIQVHYHPRAGVVIAPDLTKVGLYFAHAPVEKIVTKLSVYAHGFTIPAGASRVVVGGSKVITEDLDLYAILGHMHYLGKQLTATALLPTGERVCLLTINNWDIHWQGTYTYRTPIRLPAGTRIDVVGVYDNSIGNPSNPTFPPREVSEGFTAPDEMCGAELIYAPAAQHLHVLP